MPWCSCNLTVMTNFSKIFPKLAREHVIRNAGWTQWEIMWFYSSGINILFFGHINIYGYVVKCHYKAIWYDMIFHAYSFTSKLWGVSCEYFRENWMCQMAPHYIYTIWCLLHWMLRAIDWNYNIYMCITSPICSKSSQWLAAPLQKIGSENLRVLWDFSAI